MPRSHPLKNRRSFSNAFERAELENPFVRASNSSRGAISNIADPMRAETRAAVSYGFLEFFFCSTPTHHEKAARHSTRARRHAQPFSNYGGEADARGDARRARRRGVRLSAPEVPLAGDARGDAHRASVRGPDGPGGGIGGRRAEPLAARERGASRVRPAVRRGEGEHRPGDRGARAPGVRCRRGHERARCVPFEFEPRHRDIVGFLPRALVFKIRTDARPTSSERTQAPRILDRSPTPRLGRPIRARASPWRTSRPRSSTWCVARAFPARRGRAKTNTADARFEQRHFFPLGFENAIRARVTSSGLPFPPIPPAPSSTDRDPFPPRAGTPQARQIGATRGRAGTPKRTPRRTRARASRISPRAAFSKNARHFLRSSLVSAFETRVTPGR